MNNKKDYSVLIGSIVGFILILVSSLIIDKVIPVDYEIINSIPSPDASKTVYIYILLIQGQLVIFLTELLFHQKKIFLT